MDYTDPIGKHFVRYGAGSIYGGLRQEGYVMKNRKILADGEGAMKSSNFNLYVFFSYTLYGFLVALFISSILQNPNYMFGDNEKFMLEYMKGGKTIFPLAWGGRDYWPSFGRFWPMYFQEYNLLSFFPVFMKNTSIVLGCYLLNSVCFLIFAFCFFQLLKKIILNLTQDSAPLWIVLFFPLSLCFFLFHSEFDRCFWDIIFAERPIVILLSIYLFSYYSAYTSREPRYLLYGIAGISVIVMSYYKETAFLFSLIPACVWLLFAYKTMTKEHRYFCFFVIVNAIIFLLLYYFFAYRKTIQFYNEGRYVLTPFGTACKVFEQNFTIIFLFLAAVVRLFFVLCFKSRKHLFFDGVLFSGTAVCCAFFVLKLPDAYYYIPVFFCAVVVYLYWLVFFLKKIRILSLCFLIISVLAFVFLNQTLENLVKIYHNNQQAKIEDYAFTQELLTKIKLEGSLYYIDPAQDRPLFDMFSTFIRYVSKEIHLDRQVLIQVDHIPENLKKDDLLVFSRGNPKFAEFMENATFEPFAECKLFSALQKKNAVSFTSVVDFQRPIPLKGFSPPEQDGRWLIADPASVSLNISSRNTDLLVILKFTPFLLPQIPKRLFSVWCNGEKIKEWNYTLSSPGNGMESFILPKRLIKKGTICLSFRTSPLISPKELNLNKDARPLGVFMRQLTLEPVPLFEKGDEIIFSDPRLETTGFFPIESHGRWTIASEATLNFDSFKVSPYQDLNLAFTVLPCLSPKYPEKTIQIFANGTFIATWKMNLQDKYPAIRKLRIPQKVLLSAKGRLLLQFKISPLFTPNSQHLSQDNRLLGVYFTKVTQE